MNPEQTLSTLLQATNTKKSSIYRFPHPAFPWNSEGPTTARHSDDGRSPGLWMDSQLQSVGGGDSDEQPKKGDRSGIRMAGLSTSRNGVQEARSFSMGNPESRTGSSRSFPQASTSFAEKRAILPTNSAQTGSFIEISDPNGNTLTLTYTSGLLTQVSNNFGKSLSIQYSNNRISSITDPKSQSISMSIPMETSQASPILMTIPSAMPIRTTISRTNMIPTAISSATGDMITGQSHQLLQPHQRQCPSGRDKPHLSSRRHGCDKIYRDNHLHHRRHRWHQCGSGDRGLLDLRRGKQELPVQQLA